MKKISIVVPCYNEEENVVPMSQALSKVMRDELGSYDYEIIFIDNCSSDGTRSLLTEICRNDKKVKAIFNAKNFGPMNSPYYGLCQAQGDCAILFCCDFQDPVELIPQMVREWEDGYKIVCCIKTASKENRLMRLMRTVYYKLIRMMSSTEQIEHFTGFGLYDRSFLHILKNLDDPAPFLRGIVAELGFRRKEIPYEQQKRRAGKSHLNFFTLYDTAMLSFTSYTKVGLRVAVFGGGHPVCSQPGDGAGLSGSQADILGQVRGRHDADTPGGICPGIDTDILHRAIGGVHHEHKYQGDTQAAGGRGEAHQL